MFMVHRCALQMLEESLSEQKSVLEHSLRSTQKLRELHKTNPQRLKLLSFIMDQEHDQNRHNHHPVRCLLKFYLRVILIIISIGSILAILYFFYYLLLRPFDPAVLMASLIGGFADGFVLSFGFLLVLAVIWGLYDGIILVFSRIVFYAQIWAGLLDMLAGRLERWIEALRFQRL
ncbi:hypothetical protein BHYA_0056g00410 [Botrytis hyacinthi]|uniref:Uncharacterized protein n=1 Tax=Botrytis hyacinthi TaxID=278943 RepID=A0A4Z1GVU5_9HELO|nr:hypothetical protein BHYA_0056g00410 [Botrytis hyacinthi]